MFLRSPFKFSPALGSFAGVVALFMGPLLPAAYCEELARPKRLEQIGEAPPSNTPDSWSQGNLGRQAERLHRLWGKDGPTYRTRPRLIEGGQTSPVILPPEVLNPDTEGCITVAALATPNLSFLLVFPQNEQTPRRRAWPIPSAAGVAEITRCGARKPLLLGLALKMRSRRGIVEFIVSSSEHPPTPASELLQGRNAGPSLPSPQVGRRPYLAPLKERLSKKKDSNRLRGAHSMTVSGLQANSSGRGSTVVHLTAGCHSLDLLAEPHPPAPPDLDGKLFALSTGEVLQVDEEHSGEVSLSHCVGRTERVTIEFSGARPGAEISLLQSTWELPAGIPLVWGAVARSQLARAMWNNRLDPLEGRPVFASLGVRGTTHLAFSSELGACYIAAIAPIRGKLKRVALAIEMQGGFRETQSLKNGVGASLTFCSQEINPVRIEAQALGTGVAWILGIWQISGEAPQ